MLRVLYLICFLDLLSMGILLPVAPTHLLTLGASRFLIGALTSLNALLQLISGPLIGSWSDSKGRKPLLIQCVFLIVISNLLLLFTSSLYIYIASRILFGLTGHIQILLKSLVVSGVPKSNQNDVFAMMGAMAGLSFVFGPLLGGVVSSMEDGFFKIAVILNMFAVINLATSFFVSDTQEISTRKNIKEKPILQELTQAFTNLSQVNWSIFWDVFLFKFLAESANSSFFTTFGIVMMDYLGATQAQMAMLISLFSVMMIVLNLSMSRIKAKFYQDDSSGYKRNLHGFIGLFCAFLLVYLYNGFWMYAFLMVQIGVFRTILDTTWSEMLVARVTDSDKGSIMGSFESIMQMANLITPMVTTYYGEKYGFIETYILTLIFIAFAVLSGGYCFITKVQQIKTD